MAEEGKGELAEAEIVVGVTGPFDVKVVAPVEGDVHLATFQFVDDGAVVDTMDRHLAPGAFVEKLVGLAGQLGDADGADAESAFGDNEVAAGFLVSRVDLQEHDVFGIVLADNGLAKERPVAGVIEGRGMVAPGSGRVVGGREDGLEGVEGREALDLNEPGFGFSGSVAHEAEIDLGEEGLVRFVRDAEERRNGGFGGGAVVAAFG